MANPARMRWRKLLGDLRAMPGRIAVMVLALAVSLIGFGAVLGARTVLRREIATSYLGSRPADATLELAGDVDRALLGEVRARPEIAEADARDAVIARVAPAAAATAAGGAHGGGGGHDATAMAALHGHGGHGADAPATVSAFWQPLQLFVIDDFTALRLNTFRRESGAWPPPTGTMLIERTALGLLGAGEGDAMTVKLAHGAPTQVAISGVVHDPGLAPAWQERKGYAYITRDTLAALGEPAVLHQLRVSFRPLPAARAEVEAAATALAGWLAERGHPVRQIRVPTLRQHPHASQMTTAQMAMLIFSGLLFALSAILVATLVSALLARQVREIGVMKAIGARTAQLVAMYATAVAAIGAVACAIALPLGALLARAMIGAMSGMMNLAIDDAAIPAWVFAVQAAVGLGVPLAAAALPILGACRRTVRDALAAHGARGEQLRPSLIRLPMAAREAVRRPARLALTLALLTTGGALSATAFNVKRAYEANLERMPAMWHHDLEIQLAEPAPVALAAELAAVSGVRIAEAWGFAAAAFAQPGGLEIVHTYPDQGHGAFPVWGVPPGSPLLTLPVIAGRWLAPGDRDAIVVSARTGRRVGDTIALALDGATSTWTVVGVVDTVPAGGGYVTDAAFAAAAHTEGRARVIRIAAAGSPGDRRATLRRIEAELARRGTAVASAVAFTTVRDAMDAHVLLLVRAAIFLAAILALIGLVGLAATVGIGVAARTREIGMMKAVGATDRRIVRLVLGEAVLVGAASWIATAIVTVPITWAIDRFLTSLGFLGAELVISPGALAGWFAVVLVGSALAALAPARRAARITVREALAES